MTIQDYISTINKRYQSGIAREHTYRTDLETLIRSIVPEVEITNEPANVTDCGNPDYVITRNKIPIGFIEAKDIGKDITSKTYKEQFDRYRKALDNLIITDYIYFHFYDHGKLVHEIRIAEIKFPSSGGVSAGRGGKFPSSGGVSAGRGGKFPSSGGVSVGRGGKFPSSGGVSAGQGGIIPLPNNFEQFENLIKNFCTFIGQTIKSSKKLAEMMAAKARLLQNILENAVTSDEETQENTSLRDQYKTFKDILIHDLTPKAFADIYAQTLAYGMFAARLHDKTLDDFSRQEAAELIPKSNPFLRKLFGYVAGPDIDERIVRTVDNLANVFLATNVEELLKNFGKSTQTNDPIIHFYETFLAEYDPKLRKSRGVWYTPEPVVKFIVRAVDDILKTEFNLPQGLADTSKTKIKVPLQGKMIEKEVHKVQILDPATGTGTFLAEVVKYIYSKKFKAMQGAWSSYVDEHLIPRLNGFELLMASYSMAHLKLDMLLTETGYKATKNQRFNIYLTNSLEEHHPDTGTLFSNWLSTEANEANHIKRDTPVMVVMGNPPYSGESANKGDWIMKLMDDYKKEPGGKEKLKERNPKWINDDYVKFLRYGQYFIEKNGEGILAFINPHGFLDNPTFRGMRWNLLKTYDKIYTIDLHGNSKKKETTPDGNKDENVFDIQQGVSINLFIKTGEKKKNELGKIYHYDIFGKREIKYQFLWDNNINSIPYIEIPNVKPNFFFVQKDFEVEKTYNKGFSLNECFLINTMGIVTSRDSFVIDDSKDNLEKRIKNFIILDKEKIQQQYNLKENKSWKINDVKNNVKDIKLSSFESINYRPFDKKTIYYNDIFIERSRRKIMQNFLQQDNLGLVFRRQQPHNLDLYLFISDTIIADGYIRSDNKGGETIAPLYLFSNKETDGVFAQEGLSEKGRKPNLNMQIVQKIADKIGLVFVPEKNSTTQNNFAQTTEANSPLLEGCPQGGVVNSPLLEGYPKGGVVNSPLLEGYPKGGVVNSPLLEGYPKGGVVKPVTFINNTPIKRNFVKNLPHNPKLTELAKEKRKAGILSEVLFWKQVHKKKFHAIDFDRQRIIGNYIVDFYVKTLGLVIEIDGSSHNNKEEYDAKRQEYLESLGLKVYRISDADVKKNINQVMINLENYIVNEYGETTPSFGHPSKGGESTPPFRHPSKGGEFAPIDILDYIYAVLHSPSYREKYKEFLKIDFPRVPYPKSLQKFQTLANFGSELRKIHLLESPKVEEYITSYPIDGDNKITTKIAKKDWELIQDPADFENSQYMKGRIWINETQYFDNIPLVAWEFYIGGYQPAQKWLKDRSPKKGKEGRTLNFEDILHYQKIIVALTETDRLMKEIDKIEIE